MQTSTPSRPFKRRSLFKGSALGVLGAAGLPFAAACSDIESGEGTTQATSGFDFLPTHEDWPLPVEPDLVGEPPNHPSGFTSYPEPVLAITNLPNGSGTYDLVRWNDYNLKVKRGEAEGRVAPLPPLAAKGRTPTVAMAAGVGGRTFLNKDLSREQVEEILDVANWSSAPYGTTEYQLLQYGIEGEHFDLGEDGTPVYTPLGSEIVQAPVNYKQLSCQVETFLTGDPDMVAERFAYDASIQEYAMEDPFAGVRIEAPAEAKAAGTTLWDRQQDIAFGRAELSSIPEMVETYLKNGGEAAREHYTEAYKTVYGDE